MSLFLLQNCLGMCGGAYTINLTCIARQYADSVAPWGAFKIVCCFDHPINLMFSLYGGSDMALTESGSGKKGHFNHTPACGRSMAREFKL